MEGSTLVETVSGLDQAVIITVVIAIAAVAITSLLVAGRRRTQTALLADLRRARSEARRWPTTEHHRETVVYARALFERLMAAPADTGVSDVRPADSTDTDDVGSDIKPTDSAESADEGEGDEAASDGRDRNDELAGV